MFAYVGVYGKLRAMKVELQTERLVLRPMDGADEDALHEFWTQPEVRRYLWDGKILSKDNVREIIDQSVQDFATGGYGFFTIRRHDDFAGFCGYRRFEDGEQVELLYGIVPKFWGEGLVAEAAREVLRYGFEQAGIARVLAAADTPNQRSVRVLQKLGMVFQERREFHGLDTVFYAIDREDFYATA